MRRYLISASKLDRLDVCPPSAVLPIRTNESGAYAERGTEIHEYARRCGPVSKFLDLVSSAEMACALDCVSIENRKTCEQLDFATALAGLTICIAEPAYAVDAATGEVTFLGTNIGRDYEGAMKRLHNRLLSETEVCCSLDVEALTDAGLPCAADWKSGNQTKAVEDMGQMKLQCYVLMKKYDASEVLARVNYIDESGSVWVEQHWFSCFELEDVPSWIQGIQKRMVEAQVMLDNGEMPMLYPSNECKYCESLRGCPAQVTLIKQAFLELDSTDTSAMTLEQVGQAYGKLKQLKTPLDKIEDALKLMINQNGGAPADPGFEYKQSTGSRSYLPPDAVRGMLIQKGIALTELTKLTKTTTYPVIKRVKLRK